MMRILMANYEFPPLGGGGATANYYLAREMVKAGNNVTVLTSGFRGLPNRADIDGIEVLRVPVWRRRRDYTKMHEMLQYVMLAAPKAASMGRNWDIVQTFFALPSGLVGWWPSKLARIPHVIRIGGGDLPGHEKRFGTAHKILHPVLGKLLRGADARVVNSQGLQERARSVFPDLEFNIINNGVDTELFRPATDANNDVPTVIFVSRLIERKGLQFLIETLAGLNRNGVLFNLMVVGDGPMRAQLEAQVNDTGLTDRVQFLGLRDRAELPDIYRQGDMFCLPSSSEGMANVVLEAMATGLPVVTTAVPGTGELVQDGVNGFVIEKPDANLLRDPLNILLTDKKMRMRLGQESRRRSEEFAWSKMAAMYIEMYQNLINAS